MKPNSIVCTANTGNMLFAYPSKTKQYTDIGLMLITKHCLFFSIPLCEVKVTGLHESLLWRFFEF